MTFEKIIYDFIWFTAKQHKIKKEIILKSKENGGIGLHDLRTSVLAMRLSFLTRKLRMSGSLGWELALEENLAILKTWPVQLPNRLRITQFYKKIMNVELLTSFKTTNQGSVQVFNEIYPVSKLTTKYFYDLLLTE